MNRNNASALPNANLAPVDIMEVQWAFEARERDELTIKEGDQLFLLSAGAANEWVPARRVSGPQANASDEPSGLVPMSYLKKLKPLCRGSALYAYEAENRNCISMRVGWKLDIYSALGPWVLVKVDRFNGQPGGLGYVPGIYLDIFDEGEKEIFQPAALKEPPREVCNLLLVSPDVIHPAHFSTAIYVKIQSNIPLILSARNAAFRTAIRFIFVLTAPIDGKHSSFTKA
ncbi:cytoskeletal protein binding protein [Tulasnella sp. 408]|nr:cytoskeletal protein binding protein [Tulasnella sp. 408]